MALSRARYDDVVIPFARRSSILENTVLQERRQSTPVGIELHRRFLREYQKSISATEAIPESEAIKDEVSEDDVLEEEEEEEFTQEDFEDLPAPQKVNPIFRCSHVVGKRLVAIGRGNKRTLRVTLGVILTLAYFAFFAYAMYVEQLQNSNSVRLLVVTCIVVFFFVVYFIKRCLHGNYEKWPDAAMGPWRELNRKTNGKANLVLTIISSLVIIASFIALLVEMVAKKNPQNLISLFGIFLIILIGFLGSTNSERIIWRPVITGLFIQLMLALIILKTTPGLQLFKFIGDRVTEFLTHTNAGSDFVFDVFGETQLKLSNFAFRILPIIIFFSTTISVLYYLGAMQLLIGKVAWFMQMVMGTTAGESLNAAGNIFVGMTEAPLMIRPFIGRMTNSELHAVMSGGFATIAGSVLGAYIKFGVPANHLITASVMSAPAALAMSKLLHPETKKSKTKVSDLHVMEKSPYNNLVEAASGGALASIQLVANIAASLIAFLAMLEFVNQTLTWLGNRAGMEQELTFQLICSYVLWPLAFAMGVEVPDCRYVGELIGVKTFLNEYIAYTNLAKMIKNRELFEGLISKHSISNYTITSVGSSIFVPQLNKTFVGGFLQSRRSEAIATYSLCGFSNIGAIGIMLGGLSALAPHRTKDISTIAVRAMICGNLACFLTACVAGLFFDPTTER